MVDKQTIAFYDGAADRYDSLTATGKPDAHLRAFMDLLPKGARVLDLGCGPARASVHMRAAGFDPDPVDASVGMVTLANETHDIGASVMTFDQIDMIAAYDGIWANFSLLHAPRADLPHHLHAIAAALKPNGVFHIGMKTGQGTERDQIDRFYTYVSVPELQDLIEATGLSVVATETGKAKGCAGTVDPFVIMRAVKHA